MLKKNNYLADIWKMKKLGLLKSYKPTTPVNCVRSHNRNETDKHFVCKSMAVKALLDKGHTVFTEFEVPGKAVADVYDATLNIVLEFETNFDKKKEYVKLLQFKNYVNEVYVFDLDEIPENYTQIKRFIVWRLGLN